MKQQLKSIEQDAVGIWELPNLFGIYKKGTRPTQTSIQVMAENAYLEGKNADANPFCKDKNPNKHNEWHTHWRNLNIAEKYC